MGDGRRTIPQRREQSWMQSDKDSHKTMGGPGFVRENAVRDFPGAMVMMMDRQQIITQRRRLGHMSRTCAVCVHT